MPGEPTGREHVTPVAIDTISVTDRQAFRKDRLGWLLGTVHRLQAPGGEVYLQFGTAMHAALDVYHRSKAKPKARQGAAMRRFDTEWSVATQQAIVDYGFMWTTIEADYVSHAKLGRAMLEGYFAADDGANILSDYPPLVRTITTETRLTAPIPGTSGFLTGKLDWTGEAGGYEGEGAMDHKHLGSSHSSEFLDTDDQLTAYAWLYRAVKGRLLDWVGYNVLLKKLPFSEKTGKPTTSRLFTRDITFRSAEQLDVFGEYLAQEFEDMRAVAADPARAYPSTPSASGYSPRPAAWPIQRAILLGDDVEDVIRSGFVIGDPRE